MSPGTSRCPSKLPLSTTAWELCDCWAIPVVTPHFRISSQSSNKHKPVKQDTQDAQGTCGRNNQGAGREAKGVCLMAPHGSAATFGDLLPYPPERYWDAPTKN